MDSRRDIAEALNAALAEMGRKTLALEAILPMIGDGARALVARALAAPDSREHSHGVASRPLAESDDHALVDHTRSLFERAYAARPCVHTTLMPGAAEAIAIELPKGIITNKPRALTLLVLEGLSLTSLFPGRLVRAGGDGPMKPSPDGLHALIAELGANAAKTWMVGDGPQDVLAGRAAGCFTIAVPGIAERDRVLAAGPDLVLESLHDVAALARMHRA